MTNCKCVAVAHPNDAYQFGEAISGEKLARELLFLRSTEL